MSGFCHVHKVVVTQRLILRIDPARLLEVYSVLGCVRTLEITLLAWLARNELMNARFFHFRILFNDRLDFGLFTHDEDFVA